MSESEPAESGTLPDPELSLPTARSLCARRLLLVLSYRIARTDHTALTTLQTNTDSAIAY